MLQFNKASKKSARLRMALIGAAGSGKTYTALSVAQNLTVDGAKPRIAVIDTERGSASKYSDVFEFDVLELDTFHPQTYIEAMKAAEEAGYDVLIIDSLSHAWTGKEGALEQVDRVARRTQSGSTFGAWRDVTPLHNSMVDAIISARVHIIATMRAKTEYVQEKNEKTGKTSVRKVGMAPVQRDGLEYEFDVVADLDQDNNLLIGKTRCPALTGAVFPKAGRDVARKLSAWLSDGSSTPTFNGSPNSRRSERTEPVRETHHEERAESIPAAEPAVAAQAVAPVAATNPDAILCHCGIEARYVHGKSANGWVCGHQGTDEPTCDFRLKDARPVMDFDEADDLLADTQDEMAAEAAPVEKKALKNHLAAA